MRRFDVKVCATGLNCDFCIATENTLEFSDIPLERIQSVFSDSSKVLKTLGFAVWVLQRYCDDGYKAFKSRLSTYSYKYSNIYTLSDGDAKILVSIREHREV